MTAAIDNIAIIGHQGRMGRLLTSLAWDAGCVVTGADQPLTDEALAAAVAGADLVLLAVPAPAVEAVAVRVAAVLRPGAILSDICSVKVQPLQVMLDAWAGPVVGTHPLFGPEPADGTPLRVAVVPGRDEEAAAAVAGFLTRLGLDVFETSAEEHDRAVAHIQGLNFVTTLAYLAASAGVEAVTEYVTPSFERRLVSARKMMTEDAELFRSLFDANPFSQEAVRSFRSFLNLAAGGDVELLLEKAGWWWRNGHSGGGV